MNSNNLFIDVFRISPNGYLDIDMTCKEDYKFTNLTLFHYQYTDPHNYEANIPGMPNQTEGVYDLTGLLDLESDRQVLHINLNDYKGSSMYYAKISIKSKEDLEYSESIDSEEHSAVAVSDISNVYFYLLPGLLQLAKPCDPCDTDIPKDVQRAFLVMWAHLEAMRLGRWSEAETFYDLIKNNFQHCLGEFEIKPKSCNCHGQKQSHFYHRR